MPLGAGAAPAGSSSAGYGVPDSATVGNATLLPDLRTGMSQTGRYIDPTTKSYVFTADGRLRGLGTVAQLMQLAMSQVRGSSCVPDDGQTFGTIREKNFDFRNRIAAAVASATAKITKQGLVQVISVDLVEPTAKPDAGVATVAWRDLTTNTFDRTTIGP